MRGVNKVIFIITLYKDLESKTFVTDIFLTNFWN